MVRLTEYEIADILAALESLPHRTRIVESDDVIQTHPVTCPECHEKFDADISVDCPAVDEDDSFAGLWGNTGGRHRLTMSNVLERVYEIMEKAAATTR